MRTHTLCALSALVVSSLLPAQNWVETFTWPDGPIPPNSGWTAQSGTWAVKNGAVNQSNAAWSYLTKDNINAYNCVVEVDCTWTAAGVQFAGVAARHIGTSANDCVMSKIQCNSSTPVGYDTAFCYEQPGSAVSKAGITPTPLTCRVRMVTLSGNATMSVDTDMNGSFDLVVGTKVLTAHTLPGLVGVTGYSSGAAAASPSQMDNFAYYEGVLVERTGTLPKLGQTYQMDLYTPMTQIAPYVGVASITKGTVMLSQSLGIPVGYDALFDLSLSNGNYFGLVGVTNASGVGTPGFFIPNLPQIVGLEVFVAVATLDATRPLGIGPVSNNLWFKITP